MDNNKTQLANTSLADEILSNVDKDTAEIREDETTEERTSCSETQKRESVKNKRGISRRGLLGGAVAMVVGAGGAAAIPLLSSQAEEAKPASKDDIAALEYELSQLSRASSNAELTSHKTLTIDEDSTDVQYPSSKAVYTAISDKMDANQGAEFAGYVFIVGDDGKLKLSKFTSDELSAESTLPVENKVVYKAIKDLMNALDNLDAVPLKDSDHGVESGGVYKTYQETAEFTSFSECTNGINYKYEGNAIMGSEGTYSLRKIDNVLLAISQDDPSVVYTSIDNGVNWGAPYGGW